MGGLQVDEQGNLANWAVPGKPLLGVGGAMDLASGANKLIVTMTHCDRNGNSKVVPRCTLPLTARKAVDLLITDLAVFDFDTSGMRLVKLLPGVLRKLRQGQRRRQIIPWPRPATAKKDHDLRPCRQPHRLTHTQLRVRAGRDCTNAGRRRNSRPPWLITKSCRQDWARQCVYLIPRGGDHDGGCPC